jgi:hypothetical protein
MGLEMRICNRRDAEVRVRGYAKKSRDDWVCGSVRDDRRSLPKRGSGLGGASELQRAAYIRHGCSGAQLENNGRTRLGRNMGEGL